MRKIILGLLLVLFLGQIAQAQPVKDVAVIPMGITIQSIMRLTITKGGNIEFVFNSADDIQNGVPSAFGTNYETKGIISSSRNWNLDLRVDEANFIGEDGSTLALNVVDFEVTTPPNTVPSTTTVLQQEISKLLENNGGNIGTNLEFGIKWRCGKANPIPGATVSQRYSANIILTLVAAN